MQVHVCSPMLQYPSTLRWGGKEEANRRGLEMRGTLHVVLGLPPVPPHRTTTCEYH